jgi:hypothetical protein
MKRYIPLSLTPIIGVLSLFLILGPLTTNGQYPVMYFSNPFFLFLVWLVWLAYRSIKRPILQEQTPLPAEVLPSP